METTRGESGDRPYNIREQLVTFATAVASVAEKLQRRGAVESALCAQLASAASGAAANAEEADDASSKRDFIAKERIALREVKEARARLRILRGSNLLDPTHDDLLRESHELVKILSTIVKRAGG